MTQSILPITCGYHFFDHFCRNVDRLEWCATSPKNLTQEPPAHRYSSAHIWSIIFSLWIPHFWWMNLPSITPPSLSRIIDPINLCSVDRSSRTRRTDIVHSYVCEINFCCARSVRRWFFAEILIDSSGARLKNDRDAKFRGVGTFYNFFLTFIFCENF